MTNFEVKNRDGEASKWKKLTKKSTDTLNRHLQIGRYKDKEVKVRNVEGKMNFAKRLFKWFTRSKTLLVCARI